MLPGRWRRVIDYNVDIFIDLLSWKYAECSKSTSARQDFKNFMKVMESEIGDKYHESTSHLHKLMSGYFSPELRIAPNGTKPSKIYEMNPETKEFEKQFDNEITNILRGARYSLICAEEFNYSYRNSHSFSIPTRILWNEYDKDFASSIGLPLYRMSPEFVNGIQTPSEAERVLILHRGVGIHQTTRFYYSEKIDEIMRRFWHWTSGFAIRFLRKVRGQIAMHAERTRQRGIERSAPFIEVLTATYAHAEQNYIRVIMEKAEQFIKWWNTADEFDTNKRTPLPAQSPDIPLESEIDTDATRLTQIPRKLYYDKPLRDALSVRLSLDEISLGIVNTILPVTLQEPSFRDVVVIYRRTNPVKSFTVDYQCAREYLKTGHVTDGHTNPLNIYVRHYRNVPIADLELLLPDTRVHISSADELRFLIMSAVAAFAVIPAMSQPLPDLYSSPAWLAAAVASSSYYLRTLSRLYSSWVYYSTLPKSFLADKVNAAGPAAVTWFGLQAQDQILKEVAVTYVAMYPLHRLYPNSYDTIKSIGAEIIQQFTGDKTCGFEPEFALRHMVELGYIEPYFDGIPVNIKEWDGDQFHLLSFLFSSKIQLMESSSDS